MEESITEMSLGILANIKLDSRRSASKQLIRQGEMIYFLLLGRYTFTKNVRKIHRMKIVFFWKIYHASIIDELIMRVNFRISKFLKTSLSKY